jgi:hypothetical protein
LPCLLLLRTPKPYSKWLSAAGIASLLLLPWMFRTYVLTGWLVFPFPLMDIFDTDFKMPTALVSFSQLEISMWPKFPGMEAEFAELYPPLSWIPAWFSRQSAGTLFLIAGAALTPVPVLWARFKRSFPDLPFLLTLTLWAGVLYWFFLAPDIRFGKPFLLGACIAGLFALLTIFPLDRLFSHPQTSRWFLFIVLFIVLLMQVRGTGALGMPKTLLESRRWLVQEPHPASVTLQLYAVPVKGGVIYVPAGDERCFNSPLPCAPGETRNLEFRSDTLLSGFRISRP